MSRFKISTVLENRSSLVTLLGNVNIIKDYYPSFAFATGPTGPTGTSGGGSGGGDILLITNSLSTIDLTTGSTIINNYTQSGLSVSLQTPTTSILKTIKLSSGSFSTNVVTGYGTLILEGGNIVQLIYLNSQWNVVTSTGLVVPVTQFGNKLIGSGGVGAIQRQGSSVALSSDGTTLAIGGSSDNNNTGATWVFTRNSEMWIQQGEKLVGSGAVGASPFQGVRVALSADGNTLAIGGTGDSNFIGAVWIFTRSGGVWTQQGNKLVGSGVTGSSSAQGRVALSADGNTLAVGGSNDNSNIGATWIFTRSNGVWTQQGNKLVGSGNTGVTQQGTSVSLSNDGNTLAIGGPTDNSSIGATWIFTRSVGVWTQEGNKLVGSGGIDVQQQGQSVSLSGDGNILAIGGPGDNSGIGATWIFTRSVGIWTQEGNKLVGSGNTGTSTQGSSVYLSDNANILAIGGVSDNGGTGAVWIFKRISSMFTQQGAKLVGSGGVVPPNESIANSNQGNSVSLSSSGSILAIGGSNDNSGIGATWIFA